MAKTINISDDDYAIFFDIDPDPKFWISNFIASRIDAQVAERRNQPGWMAVAISYAQQGGDPEDGRGVLAHGLITGAFKDAATRKAEAEATEQPTIVAADQSSAAKAT